MKKKVFRERYNNEVKFEIPNKEHKEIVKILKEVIETSEVIAKGEIKPKKRGRKSVKSDK